MTAAAAAVLVLILGAVGWFGKNTIRPVDSVVMLDVNPSISLSVDAKERVLSAEALNDDAKEVLGDMELKNTSLDVALNAIIGSMLQKGYLGDLQNSILVTVENPDAARSEELQKKVSDAIENAMQADTLDAAILSQSVDANDDALKTLADQYNISMGKAALIQEVIRQDPSLSFESLASLSINEIALIASSKNLSSDAVSQSGSASEKAYIGQEEALNKALEHAGVSMSELTKCEAEFDSEDGVMVYEIEFETNEKKCEYDIEARTGEILKFEIKDKTGSSDSGKTAANSDGTNEASVNEAAGNGTAASETTANETAAGETSSNETVSGAGAEGSAAGGKIGEEAAKEIALNHAGIAERDTYYAVCYLAYDKGREDHYEVKFMAGSTAYQYGIDLYTGEVLHHKEEDHRDYHGSHHGHYGDHGGHSAASEEIIDD